MLRTKNTSVTIHELAACQSYTFLVGLVGPLGLGPLSREPQSIITQFNPKAAPKNLRVLTDPHNNTAMSVTWSAPCSVMTQSIPYEVSVLVIYKSLGL